MSINHRTFELKKAHLALINNLLIKPDKLALLSSKSTKSPFSDNDLMEDLGFLIVGKELTDEQKKLKTENGEHFYTRDNEEELLKIYEELPTALEIVLNTLSFEEGKYRTRFYEINWKKIK